jgi:hypothetical protein
VGGEGAVGLWMILAKTSKTGCVVAGTRFMTNRF